MGLNYLFSNRFRNYFAVSLVLSVAMLYGVFALPMVGYVLPSVSNYTTVTNNWTYINITSDENLSNASIEWGNSSGFTNVSMVNVSLLNWYENMTLLVDDVYNYTIWAQNTTGNWTQSDRRFVVIDTIMPYNLYSCQDLTVENGSYVLVSNVSSNGTCFNIMANNITLDGGGYTVEYAKTVSGYGVNNSGGYDNVTIKNLDVLQGNSWVDYSSAVYFNNVTSGNIINNTLITKGNYNSGIYINIASEFNISNNSISVSGYDAYGIYTYYSSGVNILNNIIDIYFSESGIYVDSSYDSFIEYNILNLNSTFSSGIYLVNTTRINNAFNSIFLYYSYSMGVVEYNSKESVYFNNTMISESVDETIGYYLDTLNSSRYLNNTLLGFRTGFLFDGVLNATLSGNNISSTYRSFYVEKSNDVMHYNQSIDTTNIIDGQSIYYYFNQSNQVIENFYNPGFIYVINSTNMTFKNVTIINKSLGFLMAMNINSSIIDSNMSFSSISVMYSSGTNISGNFIRSNKLENLYMKYSVSNNIINNTIISFSSSSDGIYVGSNSNSNNITNNNITTFGSSSNGLYLYFSDFNNVADNNITTFGDSSDGIYGSYFDYNNMIRNNIITLGTSSNGLYFVSSNYNFMRNMDISVLGDQSKGIYLRFSNSNNFYNLSMSTYNVSSMGVYFYYSNFNDVRDNNIITYNISSKGLFLYASPRNNMTNNNINTLSNHSSGIFQEYSNYNNYINNHINTSGNSSDGIYSGGSDYNTYVNNDVNTLGISSDAIHLFSSDTNTLTNNTLYTLGNYSDGLFLSLSNSNNYIFNDVITVGDFSKGIYIEESSLTNYSNNNINTLGMNSYGLEFYISDINRISNNLIITTGIGSSGLYSYSSDLNVISDNNINTFGFDGRGVYLRYSNEFNIFGGSIWSMQSYDYYLDGASTSNTFKNTNFTNSRKIYFNDNSSGFNYNDDASGDVWVNMSVSASTNITREIFNWNNTLVKWNDTNSTSGIIATYNISGLFASSQYVIYNKAASDIDNRLLTTDSSGKLSSFSILLNGETQIIVEYVVPTPPDSGGDDSPIVDDDVFIGISDDSNETEGDNVFNDDLDPIFVDNSTSVIVEDSEIKIKAQNKIDELKELLADIDDEAILTKFEEAENALALGQYSKAYALALQAENMIEELQNESINGDSNIVSLMVLFVFLFGFAVVAAYFIYRKDGGIGIKDLDNSSDTSSDEFSIPSDSTIGGVSVPIGNESASADESFNSYENSQTQNFDLVQSNQSDINQLSDLQDGVSNSEELVYSENSDSVVDNKRVNSNQTDEIEEELEDDFQDALKKLRHENKDKS
ncbi:hypothetical protein GQ473_02770 [archaeon]|nr:hypothetical protein [archaeon]